MKRPSMFGRATLTFGSQAVSSLTNFMVAALAHGVSDLAGFGKFAIALQVGQNMIVLTQGAIGDPVLIHASSTEAEERSRQLRIGAASAAVILGVLGALIVLASAFLTSGSMRTLLLVGAAGAPFLVAQYVYRAVRFSEGDPRGALIADLVWFAVLLAAWVADLAGIWDADATRYLIAWEVGAAISALPLLRVVARHGIAQLGAYWSAAGRQSIRLGVEAALDRSVWLTSLVTAQLVLGERFSGSLAAAVLVLSPMSVVHSAASAFFVPRFVRRGGLHVPRPRGIGAVTAAVTAATMALIAIVTLANVWGLAPGPFNLLDKDVTWELFFATAARFVGLAVWRGPLVGLLVADATERALKVRVMSTIVQWILPVFLMGISLTWGAIALAIGVWIGATASWREWWSLYRLQSPSRGSVTTTA